METDAPRQSPVHAWQDPSAPRLGNKRQGNSDSDPFFSLTPFSRRPQCGAQHARTTGEGLGPERNCSHVEPHEFASMPRRVCQRG